MFEHPPRIRAERVAAYPRRMFVSGLFFDQGELLRVVSLGLGVVRVGRPVGGVLLGLVPPHVPSGARTAREEFQIRPFAARFDQSVLLVGFSAVLSLPRRDDVLLRASRLEGPGVLALHSEEDHLGDVPEVEADSAAVGASVLPRFVPYQIRLVFEAPCRKHRQPVGKQRVGNP